MLRIQKVTYASETFSYPATVSATFIGPEAEARKFYDALEYLMNSNAGFDTEPFYQDSPEKIAEEQKQVGEKR